MRQHKSVVALAGVIAMSLAASAVADEPKSVEWSRDLIATFQKSRDEGRPMIVLLESKESVDCNKLVAVTLRSAEFQRFAGRGLFVDVDVEDPGRAPDQVKKFIGELGVNSYPTFTVMIARSDEIVEIGRITGYVEPVEFSRQFAMLLLDYHARVQADAVAAKPPVGDAVASEPVAPRAD